jgi:competence protein ComEA
MPTTARIVSRLAGALLLGWSLVGTCAETVDINSADASRIAEVMVGIGNSKAEAIVAYRKEHGPFKSLDDLALVKGVGAKTVEKNRERLSLSQSGGAAKP